MKLRLIGRNIKKIRSQLGYTQENLAEVIECSWRYIQAIEQGNRIPKIAWLNNMAEKLKIPLKDFFNEDEPSSQ